MKEVKKAKINIMSEAVLLFLVTAGVYWIAYKFESSYISAFGLPIELINVTPALLLFVFISLSAAIYIIFTIWNLVIMLLPEHPIIRTKIVRLLLLLTIPLWHLISYGPRAKDITLYLIIFGLILVFEIFWPLIIYRDKKGFKEKIISDEVAEDETRKKSIFGKFLDHFGPFYYLIFIFFWFASMLVSTYATGQAKTQKIFPVDADDSTTAVIRMYQDKTLLIKYERWFVEFC